MAGINRALASQKTFSESRKLRGVKCVFLSHQQRDKEICKKVADYLLNADIDVYFDEYDEDLKLHRQRNNPTGITTAIRNGINSSSHMLVVVSPNTLYSTWVPFEIGYGYDKTDLRVLCLKGISKGNLPAYVRTAPVIRDIYDLNNLLEQLTGKTKDLLLETRRMSDYSSYNNPLYNVMDGLINDKY